MESTKKPIKMKKTSEKQIYDLVGRDGSFDKMEFD